MNGIVTRHPFHASGEAEGGTLAAHADEFGVDDVSTTGSIHPADNRRVSSTGLENRSKRYSR